MCGTITEALVLDISPIGSTGSLFQVQHVPTELLKLFGNYTLNIQYQKYEPFRDGRHFIYSTFKQKLTGSALETAHLHRSCQRRKSLQYMKLKGVYIELTQK